MKPGCFRFVPPIAMSFVVCCCGFPGAVFAGEEAALSANFELPFYSSYTSRGQVSNDEPVLEPSLTLSKGDVTVNVWGNYNLTDRVTDDADFDEIDFTVDYALPIPAESIEMSVGVLAYTYPNTENNPSTWEVFWTVSFPELFIIPSAEIYFDVDEGDGLYATLSLEHECALSDDLALALGVSSAVGSSNYNDYFFARDENALNDGNVYASLSYSLTESLRINGIIAYMWLWDKEIRSGAREVYFDDSDLWGGCGISYDF